MKRKKITILSAAIMLLAFLAVPMGMWGQTRDGYSYTFTAKVFDANPQTKTLNEVDWTFAGTEGGSTAYFGYDGTKGQQFGSGGNPFSSFTLSSSGISGTITEIVVNTSGASSIAGTLNVTVGGNDFGDEYTLTKDATDATFTGSASGEIVFNYAQSSSKAIYIKSISVTYSTGGGDTPTTPTITFSGNGYNIGNSNPVGTPISHDFTVSQSNLTEGVDLTVEGNGAVNPTQIAQGAGTTTVTWSFTPEAAGEISATITATSGETTAIFTITGAAKAVHNVNIASMTNGVVTTNKTTAVEGEYVALYITPNQGYVLDEITVTGDDSGEEVTITSSNSFQMPDEDVTISATFVQAQNYTFSQIDGHNPVADQTYLIVDLHSGRALTSANGTNAAPAAVEVTIENNQISTDNAALQWTFEPTDGGYIIHPAGSSDTWLYSTATNNGVRVGNNDAKVWTLDVTDVTNTDYHGFKHNGTGRYLGVYNDNNDWRAYTTVNNNIKETQIALFVLGDAPSTPSITASHVDIAYDATSGAIEYTINNSVDGATLTVATTSEWLTLGTVGETVPFTCTANEAAAERTATVTLSYVNGEETLATKEVTVTQAGNPNVVDNISDITEVGADYHVKGMVVATSSKGFIIGDGTGYVYTYMGNTPFDYTVGNNLSISGTTGQYGHIIQFTNTATIETVDETNYNGEPEYTVITEVPDYSQSYHTSDYFQFEGELTEAASGNYTNYYIALGESSICISYPTADQQEALDELLNKTVRVHGFFAGISSSTGFTVMMESVEEVIAPYVTVTPSTINAPAEGADGALVLAYENITTFIAYDFYFCDAEGQELQENPDWIEAEIIEDSLYYVIGANTSDARIAYIKVYTFDDNLDEVYAIVTVNQAEYVAPQASITFDPDFLNLSSELQYDGVLLFTYENIIVENHQSFGIQFYTFEGEETGMPNWFYAMVTPRTDVDNGEYQVSCATMANLDEARSAYFKVYAFDAENNKVYSNLATVTQAAPVYDYAVLPFVWEGGSSTDFLALNGVTANGLGTDYASGNAPYLIKFDGTGDYIQVKTDSQPGKVTINVKMIGGANTSTITIQGSADGETFTDIETLTISGNQNDVLTLETTNDFDGNDRYVRMLFTKGSNVGVGPINITKGTEPSITLTPDTFELEAEGPLNGVHMPSMTITYHNFEIAQASDFNYQFYDAEGEEQERPEWILHSEVSLITEAGYQAICIVSTNDGSARSAYFKVYALDADSNPVYSNLVTINQAAYVAPVEEESWVLTDLADLMEGDVFVIVGDNGDTYAMPNNNGTSAPSVVAIEVNDNALSEEPADNLQWNISITDNGYIFYPNGDTENWLYCISNNNGLKVGNGDNNTFIIKDDYLYNTGRERYIGIYNSQDWRSYTSINNNIADQTFSFYKKVVEPETYTLDITGYGNNEGGYYLIASPVYVNPETTGMTQGDFDLYWFDQNQVDEEWRNYEANPFNLVPGKGYLYAHKTDTTLTFTGTPYSGDGTIKLVKNDDAVFSGWNLVGNPFGVMAEISSDHYILNGAGNELIANETYYVEAMQGVFVLAENNESTVTFEPAVGALVEESISLNLTSDRSSVIDRAIVRFGEGNQLLKFQLNPNNTKLYVSQNDKDYAIVRSAAQGEMPVNFKAAENGTYTLSVNANNVDVNYLHLVDNMTGADVDLLATPSYTFEAHTTDYATRFSLVFMANGIEEGNTVETFAYFNGSEWVISNVGEATLEVVDMMGRVISSETVNGNANLSLNQVPGVYVLRLVNGNDMKVQKIVVK